MTLEPGDLVGGKYRIVRPLGSGGMGAVYEAENIRIERRIAIKVLHATTDPEHLARFEAEARAASRIGSKHITEVLDLDHLPGGQPYMVMEFLSGETLGERLERRGRLTVEETATIALQILEALRAAHGAGIVHRDLKPDNVFLACVPDSSIEVVKLLDFGISKFTAGTGELSLTRTGFAIGTPHFMSPEQATGSKEIDIRTDLYSLGVILYQCFSGQLPYDADNYNALLVQILSKPPPPLQQLVPDLEPRAAAIVARAMERRPDDRFQSAVEFQGTVAGLVAPLPAAASGAPKEGVDPPPVVPAPPAAPLQDIGPTKSSWEAVGAGKPATKRTRTVIVAVVGVAVAVAGALAIKMGGGATAIPATADQRAAPHAQSAPASAAAPVPAPSSPPAPSRAANDQPDAGDATSPSGEVRKRPTSPGRAKKKSPHRAGRSRSKPRSPDGHPEAEPRPPTSEQQPSGPARVIVRQL